MDILLIEDNPADIKIIQKILTDSKSNIYNLSIVTRLDEARKTLHHKHFDSILLDLNLPDSKGIHTFQRIKSANENIPIILLTAHQDEKLADDLVKMGADNFIIKGEVKGTYLKRMLQYSAQKQKIITTLKNKNEQLKQISQTDTLTGIYSRRYGEEQLLDEMERYNRYGTPVSIILLDADDFKNINDQYGHDAGDQVLINIAITIQKSIREIDKAIRYGGDEFIIILPHTSIKKAEIVCRRILSSDIKFYYQQEEKYVTLSLGLAELKNAETLQQFISKADQAMYQAKKKGKNQYQIYHD